VLQAAGEFWLRLLSLAAAESVTACFIPWYMCYFGRACVCCAGWAHIDIVWPAVVLPRKDLSDLSETEAEAAAVQACYRLQVRASEVS
jgi:hypothetical protein